MALATPTASPASTVLGWGSDNDGWLGQADGVESGDGGAACPAFCYTSPVEIAGAADAADIVTGSDATFAIYSDGTIKGWGSNSAGMVGDGSSVGSDVTTPQTISGATDVKQVAVGQSHTLALQNAGTVLAWGRDAEGQLGNGSGSSLNVISPAPVSGLTDVKQLAAGGGFSLALLNDGTVKAWGANNLGQLGTGAAGPAVESPTTVTGLTNVKEIAAGSVHGLALLNDGTVKAWGSDSYGAVGDGPGEDNCGIPCRTSPVTALTGATAIEAGHTDSYAIVAGGAVKSWGADDYGQLGDGTGSPNTCSAADCAKAPTDVDGLTQVVQVAGGQESAAARLSDGTVFMWGGDRQGEVGNGGGRDQEDTPVSTGLTGVTWVTTDGDDGDRSFALTGAPGGGGPGGGNPGGGDPGQNTPPPGGPPLIIVNPPITPPTVPLATKIKNATTKDFNTIKTTVAKIKPADAAKTGTVKISALDHPALGKMKADFLAGGKSLGIGALPKKSANGLILVGTGTRVFRAPGRGTLTIKLTKLGRQGLARKRYIDLRLTLTLFDARGKATRKIGTVRLGPGTTRRGR